MMPETLFLLLFFLAVFLIFYTYVIFPALLAWLTSRKPVEKTISIGNSSLIPVSILIAAYNEESVIEDKLRSIVEMTYSKEKMEVLVGSDASTDKTNEIVKAFSLKYPFIRLLEFNERRGKPQVVNDLVANARFEILVLTDANVLFAKDMLNQLVRHFQNDSTGLVGANILNIGLKKDGISIQEKSYIERENLIKYREGLLWGCMMGPFGGCFAMRKNLFENIPDGFLVDDFFIAMNVLKRKFTCINDLDAVCYEDVSNDIRQEYKRKARISAGNFQNLSRFRYLLLRPFSPEGFCFISHKFLRWITPFLILLTLVSLSVLSFYSPLYFWFLVVEILLLFSPLIDRIFGFFGIHFRLLRFVSYFSYMNLALLKGFFRYMGGVNSGVWTPTKRAA